MYVFGLFGFALGSIAPYTALDSASYTAYPVLSGLTTPRFMMRDPFGDLLVVDRGTQHILAYWESPSGSGLFTSAVILDGSGSDLNLTHGLGYQSGYVYASSDILVWRWPYTAGSRTPISSDSIQEVVFNMGAGGHGGAPSGHTTRTFVFGPDNYLYIGISSLENLDPDSSRARVVRFDWTTDSVINNGTNPLDFANGQVWADGLRNPLGLDFDLAGKLWEFDNGPDNVNRSDLANGQDIHNDNPPEEFNLLNGPVGTFYGYPDCFSIGNLTKPFGQDPDFLKQYAWGNYSHDDAWCQNTTNNRVPISAVPAHSSPIQLRFFKNGDGCGVSPNSLPCEFVGDAFATLHGSWDRAIPQGYSVIHIPFDKTTNMPIPNGIKTVASYANYQAQCLNAGHANYNCFRPAGIAFKDGYIYVSSDATGEIVRLVYTPNKKNSSEQVKGLSFGLVLSLLLLLL